LIPHQRHGLDVLELDVGDALEPPGLVAEDEADIPDLADGREELLNVLGPKIDRNEDVVKDLFVFLSRHLSHNLAHLKCHRSPLKLPASLRQLHDEDGPGVALFRREDDLRRPLARRRPATSRGPGATTLARPETKPAASVITAARRFPGTTYLDRTKYTKWPHNFSIFLQNSFHSKALQNIPM
jgi:hypothetical protein